MDILIEKVTRGRYQVQLIGRGAVSSVRINTIYAYIIHIPTFTYKFSRVYDKNTIIYYTSRIHHIITRLTTKYYLLFYSHFSIVVNANEKYENEYINKFQINRSDKGCVKLGAPTQMFLKKQNKQLVRGVPFPHRSGKNCIVNLNLFVKKLHFANFQTRVKVVCDKKYRRNDGLVDDSSTVTR